MPLLIQRPRPVPLADLVVKKGWKRRRASSGRIPMPVSVTEIAIPRRRVFGSVDVSHAQAKSSAGRHGLDGVADEIKENLAQLAGKAAHHAGGAIFFLQGDVTRKNGSLLELDDVIEQVGDRDRDGLFGIAVEAEGLACDMGGALKLGFGEARVVACLLVE